MKKITFSVALALAIPMGMQAQTLADYANAGDAAMAANKYQEAVDNYVKAQELDKDNTDYLTAFQLATAYEQLGESQKAGDAYKASIIKGNYDNGVITNMKNAYEAANCKDCIKNAYVEIKGKNPEMSYNMDRKLYFVYSKEKEWNSALSSALNVLKDPNIDQEEQVSFLKRSAQLYLNVDQPDSAMAYYEHVLNITPEDADIHKALGFTYYNQVSEITKNQQAAYKAKQAKGKATSHDYSMMQTETKRATLKYYPLAKTHLQKANATLNDAKISDMVSKINNNLAAYNK